ncbi:hypothetical protein HSX10_03605 [Winogradskyella undariae]|uniref:hypothetical protein n=1 Tax=Winogradskyella undariae TaxID=1285465 RepID=UPI00156A8BFA|nr:hypothetical protein [Winogradskyella undariae]NRR90645.1 hypothetical protein [Winogradskyella undariae]
MFKKFTDSCVRQVGVDLTDAFDQNFHNESFFGRKWPKRKMQANNKPLSKDGALRGSLKNPLIQNGKVTWSFPVSYASIHNEGGEIVVTKKMKSFFWAMYYKAHGASETYSIKTKKQNNTIRTRALKGEAAKWKALALQKVGATMTIEQRQFIGWHPQVDVRIKEVIDHNLKLLNNSIHKKLK